MKFYAKSVAGVSFTAFVVLLAFSSCNSVGPNSDKLVGEWVDQYSIHTPGQEYASVLQPGFTISRETVTDLKSGGEGRVVAKSLTTSDDGRGNTSYTIEYPITWMTKDSGARFCLIMKFGAGKVIDIQGDNKLSVEQGAMTSMNIFSGSGEVRYFTVKEDNSIRWQRKDSDEELKILKRR